MAKIEYIEAYNGRYYFKAPKVHPVTIVQAIILGFVQGLTEFLPISSSGHLVFVPALFGWEYQGLAFDVVVHLGTLLAVIVYFRKRLWSLCRCLFQTPLQLPPFRGEGKAGERILALFVVLSVIPAGIAALLFGDFIEQSMRASWIVGVSLIVWGLVLWCADRFGKKLFETQKTKTLEHMTCRQAIIISCAQVLALIPGTSRSGITMTAGLFSKLDKKVAAEFSFLMSVPVIALAGAVKFAEFISQPDLSINWLAYGAGFFAAAASGFFAIALLMKIIQRWSFTPFVVYRIIVGILILTFLV